MSSDPGINLSDVILVQADLKIAEKDHLWMGY